MDATDVMAQRQCHCWWKTNATVGWRGFRRFAVLSDSVELVDAAHVMMLSAHALAACTTSNDPLDIDWDVVGHQRSHTCLGHSSPS